MEIDLYTKLNDPLDAIGKIGEIFARSGMFGCTKTEQGQVLAMACLTEKKTPTQIIREYHLIEGRLSDRADAMLAKFKSKGGRYKVLARTPDHASVEMTYEGQTVTFSLSFEEVKAEPFVWMADGKTFKKNWRTPRARMQTLWARVVSDGVRTLAPEIVSGIYTPEEILDEIGTGEQPAQRLNLSPTAATPAAAPKSEERPVVNETPRVYTPPVVDVPPSEEVAQVEAGLAPTGNAQRQVTAAEAPPPATATQTASSPAATAAEGRGLLPAETVELIEQSIGEHAIAAMRWMQKQGWLQPGQGLEQLTQGRAQRIIKQRESFIRAITNPSGAQ
jgi:hypothetical protein